MKNRNRPARRIGIVLVLITLVGAFSPSEAAEAALHLQASGDGWSGLTLPAPERTQLVMNSEPPAGTPAEQAQLDDPNGRRPAPQTPQGSTNVTTLNAPAQIIEMTTNGATTTSSPSNFVVFQNSALTSAPSASQVNSPSAANSGPDIFASYNKYAALSTDYGGSWVYLNPDTPSWHLHGGFDGNQDVFYDSSRQVMVWVLQYAADSTGNALRLAWATGQSDLETGGWLSVPLEPAGLLGHGIYENSQFDRAQLAQTDNFVYLSANVYNSIGTAVLATTVIRFSLDELAAHGSLHLDIFSVAGGFNLTPAQGGTDTLYFSRHLDATHLRIYQWPEGVGPESVSDTYTDVSHGTYVGSGYSCTVSGKNPCGSDDDRLTAGWLWGALGDPQYLLFAWDAAQSSVPSPDSLGAHAYPYVRYVKISLPLSLPTMSPVAESGWSDSAKAMFLASAARNARGHAGGTVATAGGTNQPGCSAWISDDYNSGGFEFLSVQTGDGSPSSNAWGAYLRTRKSDVNPNQWIGTCYAIKGAVVTPDVVRFGREGDVADVGTTVTIGGTFMGEYLLRSEQATRVNYWGLDSGPVVVQHVAGVSIIAAERDSWWDGTTWSDYAQVMGLPASQVSDTYVFPVYNNVSLDEQLRFGNVDTVDTTVTITIGGVERGSYLLHPSQAVRVNYAGVDTGPVVVQGTPGVKIVAAERDSWWDGTTWSDFNQLMGLPAGQVSDKYVFPAYNNVSLDEQLRFGNVDTVDTTVTVTIGGIFRGSYLLHPSEAVRVNYAGVDSGPVVVQGTPGVKIVAAERDSWWDGRTWSSFVQLMGLPSSLLSETYVFPAYNSNTLDEQLRFGVP